MEEELAEAYVIAAHESIAEQDAKAGQMLSNFLNGVVDEQGSSTYSVRCNEQSNESNTSCKHDSEQKLGHNTEPKVSY